MMNRIIIMMSLVLLVSCKKTDDKIIRPVLKDITETVFASGILETNEKYNLTSQTEGYLTNVVFNEGDQVSLNQVLCIVDNKVNNVNALASVSQLEISKINTTDNSPALKQIMSNIKFAELKLQQDLTQLNRYKGLVESNSVSKVEVENVQILADNSQSNLNALKQQYDNLKQLAIQQNITQNSINEVNKSNLNYNKIKTLVAGKVLKKFKQVGDYVKKGDVIATIGNQNSIIAKLNVDENSIDKIKIGQKAFVQLNVQKDKPYIGTVSEILPMFDEATQSFICKIVFDKDLTFNISGTQLEANIEVGHKKNTLLIPRNLMSFGNKVMVKGKDQPVVIKVGIISTEWVEVLEGLSSSDQLLPFKP